MLGLYVVLEMDSPVGPELDMEGEQRGQRGIHLNMAGTDNRGLFSKAQEVVTTRYLYTSM